MPTLLVLDPVDGDNIRALLMEHGHTVQVADTVAEALAGMQQTPPDLVVLDHAMEPSGLLLLSKLNGVPAIVCSREQTVRDRVTCLRMGADDFVGKPYDPYELAERVDAVLRRSQPKTGKQEEPKLITLGQVSMNPARALVTVNGTPVHCTPTEFRLLALLLGTRDVLTHGELSSALWGAYHEVHLCQVHVSRLRIKLTAAGMTDPILATVRARGYQLVSVKGEES